MRRTYWKALAVGFLLAVPGWAQEDDSPGRGVARLSLINGDVSVRRGDSGDWVAAAPNAPLVVQDHVLTGANSRAEVQFDWANMLRLAANTDLRLAELENRRYQAQLARGTATLRVLRDSDADVEVDTPNVSVRPTRKGTYRIEVYDDGRTEITVRSGEAEIYTPRGVERLKSGRTMVVRGAQSDPEFQVMDARNRDDWDRWNEERDRRLERSTAYAYVSRDIYGADDLDDYGTWIYVPPYGRVWRPSYYDPAWAPYRNGRWVWIDFYGWTWLSYDPWGWAPYHYGRWFYDRPYGWCWYPGPPHYRHHWRPALVTFFGFGVGPVHVGVGFGRIGWVPLAPYEPYYPWYGRHIYHGYRSGVFVDNSVRIVNNINIINNYRNSRVVNGVSGLDYNDFGRGGRARAFTHDEIRVNPASVVHGALPVAPRQESLRLVDRDVRAPMDRSNTPERFFVRRQPAKVDRVSFADQQRGVEQIARRTFGDAGGAGGWRSAGQRREPAGAPLAGPGQPDANSGWRRIGGDNAASSGTRVERIPEGGGGWRGRAQPASEGVVRLPESGNDGWRRFGGRPAAEETGRVRNEAGAATQGGGWRGRAGDAGTIRNENRNEASRPEGADAGWRRFGGRPDSGAAERPESGGRGAGGAERRQEQPRFQEFPRSEPRSESPRSEAPPSPPRWSRSEGGDRGWSRPERSEPVRINPPIVRERSGGEGGGGWRGHSGGAAPRSERGGGGWRGNAGGGQRSEGGGRGRGGRDR